MKLTFNALTGNFNLAGIELDEYIELIFPKVPLPQRVQVISHDHQLYEYEFQVQIHHSLIHNGEDQEAVFETMDNDLVNTIARKATPGCITKLRAKRQGNRYGQWEVSCSV